MGCTMGKMARRVSQIGCTMGKTIKNVFFASFLKAQKTKNAPPGAKIRCRTYGRPLNSQPQPTIPTQVQTEKYISTIHQLSFIILFWHTFDPEQKCFLLWHKFEPDFELDAFNIFRLQFSFFLRWATCCWRERKDNGLHSEEYFDVIFCMRQSSHQASQSKMTMPPQWGAEIVCFSSKVQDIFFCNKMTMPPQWGSEIVFFRQSAGFF